MEDLSFFTFRLIIGVCLIVGPLHSSTKRNGAINMSNSAISSAVNSMGWRINTILDKKTLRLQITMPLYSARKLDLQRAYVHSVNGHWNTYLFVVQNNSKMTEFP